MPKKRNNAPTEDQVVAQFTAIAFSTDAKDSDRLRALDWLAEYLEKNRGESAMMERLDEILRKVKGEA